MLLLLLFAVSRCTDARNDVTYLARQGIHIRMAFLILADAILSVFFINVESQVFRDSLFSISA